jgi:AcrR family transcriptional regulator
MAGVRQFDESETLDKAMALFWKKGFEETTMQELAAATGVQRGSLYNAYGDKDTIFLRMFELYHQRFLQQARGALSKAKLRAALESFFDYVIKSMTTGVPTRGCLSTKTALGGAVIDQPIREALKNMLDELQTVLSERFSQAENETNLRVSPDQAAQLLVTFTRGLVVIERVYEDEKRLQSTAQMLITLLLEDRSIEG